MAGNDQMPQKTNAPTPRARFARMSNLVYHTNAMANPESLAKVLLLEADSSLQNVMEIVHLENGQVWDVMMESHGDFLMIFICNLLVG